jgi:hypothetical protein
MSYNIHTGNITSYSNQEIQLIYAFDIKIIDNNDEVIKKKLITLDKIGNILECKNNIKKIKITFCLINSDNIDTIVLKKSFNEEINDTVILYKKNIVIYVSKNKDNISINFQIL